MALSDPILSGRAGQAGADDLHSRATLVEVLRERAARQGDTVALNFLADGQEIGSTLDYRALDGRARALATVLRRHAAPGDRALILLPSGPDYLIAFFACFYASVIAVPAYPPQAMRPHHVARLEGMIADSTPRFLLTDREHVSEVRGLQAGDRSLRILSVDEVGDESRPGGGAEAEWTSGLPRADDIAFLQYTSGSTSAPKGVEVTHANLMDNQRVLSRGFGVKADDVFVSWLPLYHDMGLMTGLTLSVFWGCPLYLMAPQHFLARPARWLEALHRYGGTFSGGPDFAYRLCCERVNDKLLDRLDLSRWHVAFCGAEPVRADTMADFAERFAPAGFKAEALGPSYGLAEATLGVSLPRQGRRYTTLTVDAAALAANRIVPGTGVELVGSGRPPEPDTVGIFDPRSGDPCADGLVGEVWVAGDSVARGYWENPEATREVFVRRPGEPVERVWLRTGDLGFLVDGELFITGRCKDLIILRGENCYPQDIEKAVETAVAAVRKGRVAVFAVDCDGREGIGVAVEIGRGEQRKHRPQDLVEAIDGAVVDALQEPASLIALLEPGALPKTTSGKLQRSACRQGIAASDIAAYHVYRRPLPERGAGGDGGQALRSARERRLTDVWKEVLGIEDVGRNDNFLALGGHSLLALQAVEALRSRFGLTLSLRQLFSTKSLEELAAELVEAAAGSLSARDASLIAWPRDGALPLSPAQRRLWTAEQLAGDAAAGAYVMTGYLDLAGPLSVDALKQALAGLMDRHEILRTAYTQTADGIPLAEVSETVAFALPVIDLTDLDAAGQAARLERLEIEEANDALSLERAPLLRVTLLRQAEERHRLLISMHHIIGDAWSFGVMVDDLAALYRAAIRRQAPALAPLPLQYLDYAFWLNDWAATEAAAAEEDFWRGYLGTVRRRLDLPCDFPRPAVFDLAGDSVRFSLPGDVAKRLENLRRDHGASLFMVLLAAFEVLMHRFSGVEDMVIGTDMAGRSHRDLESLIGFFVNVLPLRARPGAADTFSDLLVQVREDVLSAFEHPLLPFDRIVDVVGVPRDRARNPLVQVLFVLQSAPKGHFDVEGLSAELHQAKARRSKFDMALFLDPLGSRSEDEIAGEWVFATSLFERTTIERLVTVWCQLLTRIADAPDCRLREIDLPILKDQAMPPSQQSEAAPSRAGRRLDAKLDRLSRLTAGAAAPRPRAAVRAEPMMPNGSLPLLVEPSAAGLDPVGWACAERDWIETRLRRHGALLFRGFDLATPQDFEAFAEAIHPGLYGSYGDLPKKEGGRNTYRSTPYPQDQMILFHNESAHLHRWPRKQWFFCEQPSEKGGATPLVDCRELYRRLPAALAERFERLGLLYQRNFTERLDVNWRDFFKTDSREAVEAACRAVGTEFTWFGDELQTRTRCPAVIVHPLTGERSFFNQVQLHHTRSLAPGLREDLIAMAGEDRLPRQVFFGDGTPIDDEIMDRLGELYEACAVRFSWRKGDVAMLDNMLAAHARDPFEGARRIVVAMGDMVNREDVQGRALEEAGE